MAERRDVVKYGNELFSSKGKVHFLINLIFGINEAGKNTSTVIPASRKRRRKGNPVASDETVMYDYESSATLTTD
jgi:hypothetical protein